MSSLNPVMKIEDQILDAMLTHSNMARPAASQQVGELLGSSASRETSRAFTRTS